jgi:hypothetical protein
MITKRPSIEDIYNHDYFMATPGVRQGLLERASMGDPELTTEMTDDGEVVYYNAPHGESIAIGRPILLAMGGSGAGQARTDAPMSEAFMGLADTLAAPVKGATQGFIGLPGDLESLSRLIVNAMGANVPEGTVLPKTEDVKTWLDKNVGKVGDGKHPMETVGEFLAPGGYVKGAKTIANVKKPIAATAATAATTTTGETTQDLENK